MTQLTRSRLPPRPPPASRPPDTVASWQAGGALRPAAAFREVAACDVAADRVASCSVFCTLAGDGDLVCEGLPEGTYTVVLADPQQACTFEGAAAHCRGPPATPPAAEAVDAMAQHSALHSLGG